MYSIWFLLKIYSSSQSQLRKKRSRHTQTPEYRRARAQKVLEAFHKQQRVSPPCSFFLFCKRWAWFPIAKKAWHVRKWVQRKGVGRSAVPEGMQPWNGCLAYAPHDVWLQYHRSPQNHRRLGWKQCRGLFEKGYGAAGCHPPDRSWPGFLPSEPRWDFRIGWDLSSVSVRL